MDSVSARLSQMDIQMPYSIQAEQAVLGAAILSADVLPSLVEILRPEHFYARTNSDIFSEMVALFTTGRAVDFVTLLNAVVGAGIFPDEQEAKVYLSNLADTVPSISNVESYAKIVHEKYLVRQLAVAAGDILSSTQTEEQADTLLENAEQRIYEIRAGRDTNSLLPLRSAIFQSLSRLQQITGPDKEKYMGIPTGFSYLDTLLTGMARSNLIILAARPGMGKTSFALNIASFVAKARGVPVCYFSLEMTNEELASRLLSTEAMVDSRAMRTGDMNESQWGAVASASDKLGGVPIFLDDTSTVTAAEIKAKVRRLNQTPGRPPVGLIIVDYLQLMGGSGTKRNENRVQEVSEITRNFKIMAKELDVPVMLLSQLSRGPDKNKGADHRPVLSDLRDSGSIEQDADVVLFLYRENYYDEAKAADTAECIVAKNRHGGTGKAYLGWDGAHTRYYNVDVVHGNDD